VADREYLTSRADDQFLPDTNWIRICCYAADLRQAKPRMRLRDGFTVVHAATVEAVGQPEAALLVLARPGAHSCDPIGRLIDPLLKAEMAAEL
jgi:hypothetical protein